MCGICGIIEPFRSSHDHAPALESLLKKMTAALRHRGPDGEGHFTQNVAPAYIGLGHRRLAIIDRSREAAQPMAALDRYHIIHNGEIYNYIELRELLSQQGYTFRTNSDTEVLVAAFDHWGTACLQQLDGMFAFAIWDTHAQKLFAARDRFGEKPFYYHYDAPNSRLLFASEMKALWAAEVPKETDPVSLFHFLCTGRAELPGIQDKSFYKHIKQLPPRHYLLYDVNENKLLVEPWWDLYKNISRSPITEKEAIEQARHNLNTSVSRRLRSDVPLGSSASGGIDSSTIIALARGLLPANEKFRLFSAIFPGFERDESPYIKTIANHLSGTLLTVTPTVNDLMEDLEQLCRTQEVPFGSAGIYAQYRVYQLAREEGVTVLLDGQGADEILAGYSKYLHWYLQELIPTPDLLKHEQEALEKNGWNIEWDWKNKVAAKFPERTADILEKRSLDAFRNHPDLHPDFIENTYKQLHLHKPVVEKLNDILYADLMQGPLQELLRYADRNAMAHGVEVRLPFLYPEFISFIFSLPSYFKIHDGWTKWILRQAMQKDLPDTITWRTGKVGFEPPQQEWMKNKELQSRIRESRKKLAEKGILKSDKMDTPIRAMDAHAANNFDWRNLVAGMIMG